MEGINPHKRVRVYRNLNRRCWSVQQGGRVVAHLDALNLENVRMVVQPGGQRRVRESGHKFVHAFLEGELRPEAPLDHPHPITYHPGTDDGFHLLDDPTPLQSAARARFTVTGTAEIEDPCAALS